MMHAPSVAANFTGVDACYLGLHNGSWPNGTVGAGTWTEFGKYSPTMDEMMACQAGNDPWSASSKYGLWTTYFFLALFVSAGIYNAFLSLDALNRGAALLSPFAIPARIKAVVRSVNQRKTLDWSPEIGVVLLAAVFTAFSFAVCFGIRPYYRPPNFGSSPLGLRSEWIATALIVWIITTATKRNPLSYLSGIPFHRLMSLHKLLPWFCLFFALVHTVAMIICENQQQPWRVTLATNAAYGWSAWTALASLAFLCFASLPPVRRLSHEFFYPAHIVAAILMLVACYDHFEGLLGSWSYLHAAVVLLGVAFVHRLAAVAFVSRLFTRPETAVVEMSGDSAIFVTINVSNAEMKWTAAQHVFVRFLTLQPWQTHPFTIASLDASTTLLSSSNLLKNEMKFIIRPRAGLTAHLARLASSAPPNSPLSLPVFLDGPYGPSSPLSNILSGSTSALFVAGGTGISFVLPLIVALVEGTQEVHAVTEVRVVWAVKTTKCVGWARKELEKVVRSVKAENEKGKREGAGWTGVEKLEVDIFVTRAETPALGDSKTSSSDELGEVQEEATPSSSSPLVLQTGRPDIAETVDAATRTCQKRLAVVACGPSSLLLEARNAVARVQLAIAIQGRVKSEEGGIARDGVEEIVFWEEKYAL
ncbi:ferric-chelate reductase [Rhodotorula toruloides]|uniref:Ferric-chelate reductase n=1 Tax=Rhodotorula toruloides TaxID=5286 RepID=A0A511KF47_RHOTO|nr:ferric-chelate reductase [Rhodotorula toruloides]